MIAPTDAPSLVPASSSTLTKLLAAPRSATARMLAMALAIGFLFNAMLRATDIGLLTAIFFTVAAAALGLTAWKQRNRTFFIALAAVPLFAAWLAVRSSPWLLPLDLLAVLLLLFVAASFAGGGSPFALSVPGAVTRMLAVIPQAAIALPFITAPLRALSSRTSSNAMPIVRGVLIAAPIFLILLALLASADAVFASIFDWNLDIETGVGHIVLVLIGTWLFATAIRIAVSDSPDDDKQISIRIGATEGLIAVGSLVALFAAFVSSQIVVWAGGADRVLETAGLTYAENAREGFFQLLAVAVITLVVLMTARACTNLESANHRRWFRVLSLAAVALTLAIVAVALRRLGLYEDAYGLTMLRLFSTVFAIWIAIVFVLLAAVILSVKQGRWFIGTAVSVGLVILFALNVMNPEAFVVNRNIDRETQTVPFDASYTGSLSADAVPAVIASLDEMTPEQRTTALNRLCAGVSDIDGWTAWNWSRDRAADESASYCSTTNTPATTQPRS